MEQKGATTQSIRSLADALNRCQELGMRLSRQRRFILQLLWSKQEHLSAKQVYDLISQQGKHIGHTSVYQNLEALSNHGIIECVDRHDGRLYGSVTDRLSHVNVIDTNKIINVCVELPPEIIAEIEAKTGVTVTNYRVDFFGYSNQN